MTREGQLIFTPDSSLTRIVIGVLALSMAEDKPWHFQAADLHDIG